MLTKFTGIAKNLPSFIYKTAAQAYIDYDFPRHIFIETTANCNLSCDFCPREKRKEDMNFELFKQIIDECTEYGPRSFSLHLFGEPLLYPSIIEAIRYIKKRNKRHTVLLTTNGTLLNKFCEEIDEAGTDRIIWSYRKNNFNSSSLRLLHRKGLIRLLIEETPKEEFEKWSKFPRVEVKNLHNYGGNIKVGTEPEKRWPCYHLWLAPAIRWNGEIVECCNLPKSGQDVLGNYGKDTLHSAWNGSDLVSLRKSHLKGIYPGKCGSCNSYQSYPDIFFGWQKKCSHSIA